MASVRGELGEGILTIVLSGIILSLLHEFLPKISQYFPQVSGYTGYIYDAFAIIISILVAHLIIRIISHSIEYYSSKSGSRKNLRGILVLLRIIIYSIAIFAALALSGVNIEGALVGGAIGGVVLGFAVQNVTSYLLSGVMVSAAGALRPKDKVYVYSWLFPSYLVGEITDVNILFTDIRDQNGQVTKMPNSALLGSTIFRNIEDGEYLKFSIDITLPNDVRVESVRKLAEQSLLENGEKYGLKRLETFFKTLNQANNVITAIFYFTEIRQLNGIIDIINNTFQESYLNVKNQKN